MRIGQVIGKVVLSRVHPSLTGAQFKIVLPLRFDDLATPDPAEEATALTGETSASDAVNRLLNPDLPSKWGNDLVVYDNCSAAIGEWLAFSEGAEAAAAFGPDKKAPVDAFAGAILDTVAIDPNVVAELRAKKK